MFFYTLSVEYPFIQQDQRLLFQFEKPRGYSFGHFRCLNRDWATTKKAGIFVLSYFVMPCLALYCLVLVFLCLYLCSLLSSHIIHCNVLTYLVSLIDLTAWKGQLDFLANAQLYPSYNKIYKVFSTISSIHPLRG